VYSFRLLLLKAATRDQFAPTRPAEIGRLGTVVEHQRLLTLDGRKEFARCTGDAGRRPATAPGLKPTPSPISTYENVVTKLIVPAGGVQIKLQEINRAGEDDSQKTRPSGGS
jgi:hypothetical protein